MRVLLAFTEYRLSPFGDARRGAKSYPGPTGMRGHDLSTVVKLLEVRGAVSHISCSEVGKESDHQVRASARSG
jgi:hypothetical protein